MSPYKLKGGTRPRYFIVPGHKLAEPALSNDEQHVLDVIRDGYHDVPKVGRYDNVWKGGNPYKIALRLVDKGLIRQVGHQVFEPVDLDDKPDWIWLPSSLVESEDDGVTPVERIRQSQNVRALRLFVDLYHAHDLRDGHGIDWRPPRGLRTVYDRQQVGQHRQFVVWAFKHKTDNG